MAMRETEERLCKPVLILACGMGHTVMQRTRRKTFWAKITLWRNYHGL